MQLPEEDEIHVWWVCDAEEIVEAGDHAILSPDEMQRLDRLLTPELKHQFVVTRRSIRTLLSACFPTVSPRDWLFERNPWGRPQVLNPEAKGRVSFNIAHTNGRILIALSGSGEVGVDVEKTTRKVRAAALAERYFSDTEAAQLLALPRALQRQRFLDLWTLKEAYIKACGMGLAIALRSFSFTLVDAQIDIAFAPQRQDDAARWQFWQLLGSEEYLVSLALADASSRNVRVQCRAWKNQQMEDCVDVRLIRRSVDS